MEGLKVGGADSRDRDKGSARRYLAAALRNLQTGLR